MSTLKTGFTSMEQASIGCIIGTAVGDALGLPAEGLSRYRQQNMLGTSIERYRFLFGRGMVSDDTEHTLIVAQSLIASGGDLPGFQWELARRLKRWLLFLPAGVGWATLRACMRLLIGVSPERSGVWSAGNGPAMRSALLGVCFGDTPQRLRAFVRISSCITHTDPRAEYGALVVALAAHLNAQGNLTVDNLLKMAHLALPGSDAEELHTLLQKSKEALSKSMCVEDFAASLGLQNGIGGFVYHTVPVALYAALCYPMDFRSAVTSIIACGGDTDTTAAIVGGIVGAGVGKAGIPTEWREDLGEPFGVEAMERLARQTAQVIISGEAQRPLTAPFYVLLFRNALFLLVVLYHGMRRLLPPY